MIKTFITLQIFLFQINAVLLNVLFINNQKTFAQLFSKIIIIRNVYEQNISILELFLKDEE